jgi:hypothetical protein
VKTISPKLPVKKGGVTVKQLFVLGQYFFLKVLQTRLQPSKEKPPEGGFANSWY